VEVEWDFGKSACGSSASQGGRPSVPGGCAPSAPAATSAVMVQLLHSNGVRHAEASLLLTPEEPRAGFHYLPPGCYALRLLGRAAAEEEGDGAELGTKELQLPSLPWPSLAADYRRNMVFAGQRLGPWMLDCDSNYMLALGSEIKDSAFLERLLAHGLFVLPSGRQPIVSCPWPRRPYVLDLAALPRHRWAQSKKLRRHAATFWLTVNSDFKANFRRCGQYHEGRGGTWITPALTDQLWALHEQASSQVRVWSFELWDRATGSLCAASFGLSIGCFFHDFSMCTLVKDHRSCGAVLSKCVGELLARCGVKLWYWGLKCPYMAEYDNFGGKEVDRHEYYSALRAAEDLAPSLEPAAPAALAGALVEPRPA